jgi:pimeloyl-ACP methyl ester carboxylesterase
MAAQTRTFTAPDGAQLAYSDAGRGMAVLCLAGLTRNLEDFDPLVPHLPPCRLIRMDYRGRGASAWTGAATYTVATEARDALALLDHLGVDRAALIGTSRGGLIGMHLAAEAPRRLWGLCLNDIGPVLERPALEQIAAYVGLPPVARTRAELAERLALTPGFADVPAGRWAEEAGRRSVETPDGLQNRHDPALRDAFRADLDSFAAPHWPLFDACAGLPLALIRGMNSSLLTEATAAEMARRRPDMIRAEVPGRAHVPFLDERESLTAIHAFLARCEAGA